MSCSKIRSSKRFKGSEDFEYRALVCPPELSKDLKITIHDFAKTDELMCQLVKSTGALVDASKKAGEEASKLSSLMKSMAKSEIEYSNQRRSLAESQKNLLKLQGIHRVCIINEDASFNSAMSERAKRLHLRNASKDPESALALTDSQIQEQKEEIDGLIKLANKRYQYMQRYHEFLEKRNEDLKTDISKLKKENLKAIEDLFELNKVHEKCVSRVSAEVLPENVLLHIFGYLSKSALIHAARPVCKTWWRVSKDCSLWKNEEVTVYTTFHVSQSLRQKISYLKIAPCIKSLFLQFPLKRSSELGKVISHSECQLSSLHVTVTDYGQYSILTNLLRRQRVSLKELVIEDNIYRQPDQKGTSYLMSLWKPISKLSGLRKLVIKNSVSLLKVKPKDIDFSKISLEEILINDCPIGLLGVLSDIVKASSSSLQVLELPIDVQGNVVNSLALGLCSKLKILRMPCLPEITAVENCPLRTLKVCSRSPSSSDIPLVAAFLKTSPVVRNLQKFEVLISNGMDGCDALAQAISFMPHLKEIKIKGSVNFPVQNMLTHLQCVPLLEKLECNTFPLSTGDIEPFISAGILPKLKLLHIPNTFNNSEKHHCLDELKNKRKNMSLSGMKIDIMRCYCTTCYEFEDESFEDDDDDDDDDDFDDSADSDF